MVHDDSWFTSDDGTKLYLRRWQPDSCKPPQSNSAAEPVSFQTASQESALLEAAQNRSPPLAVVHIAHGMAEHGGRYRRLAEKLCGAGIEVWAADQRGHGKTADINVNDAGKGGLIGHCADKNTFTRVTADIHAINLAIRRTCPGVPLFLLAHSWGSFIAQNYIETVDSSEKTIDGLMLSGTRGPAGFKIKAGRPLMALLAAVLGQRTASPLARAIADGPYNRPFRPNRTSFDWVSRDEAEVDSYLADSCSGSLCSTGFYRDLVTGLAQIHQGENMARIRRDLPVYVFCGDADPVGEMGDSPTALIKAYRSLGMTDLEFVLYPGARHETLNETNREEVTDNLLSWILSRIRRGPDQPEANSQKNLKE